MITFNVVLNMWTFLCMKIFFMGYESYLMSFYKGLPFSIYENILIRVAKYSNAWNHVGIVIIIINNSNNNYNVKLTIK